MPLTGKKNKSKMQRLRQALVFTYAAVIVAVAFGLYSLLQEREVPLQSLAVPGTEDPQVLAVLSAMGSADRTVPIEEIEAIIPTRAEPAWQLHAAKWGRQDRPQIAIVIDDLGLQVSASDRLARMPGPYTLAFLPYAEGLPAQTSRVRAAGHELLVHLPMEPKNQGADPGPNALLAGLNHDEFERRIAWNLKRFDGFVGVNNHMGSLMTEQPGQMVRLMVHLKRGGFLFLDSLTSPNSVASRAAKATGVPHIKRDIFLDNIQVRALIDEQLVKVERVARKRGYGIAIGHPYDVTLDALEDWQKRLKDKGFTLVPLSQLVAARQQATQTAQGMMADRQEQAE